MNDAPSYPRGAPSSSGISLSALGTLFALSVRQFVGGWRFIILCTLFTLPALLALLARIIHPDRLPDVDVFFQILNVVPHALLPLVALLNATGMIQDEIEDQTLTYLLVRPVPKWAIYVVKLVAAWIVSLALTAVFVTLAFVVIYAGKGPRFGEAMTTLLPRTVILFALSLTAYCSIFGCLSLLVKRSLVVGIVYVVLLEFVLVKFDFALRLITVMYYFRVLVRRWLPLDVPEMQDWSINLAEAPTSAGCVGILLAVSAVLTLVAARIFSTKEFRMKTPEGS